MTDREQTFEECCACGTMLVGCHGCLGLRCLNCDPYSEYERLNHCCQVAGTPDTNVERHRPPTTEPGHKSFYCGECGEWITHPAPNDNVYEGIEAMSDHMRVLHPDLFERMQRWPDGAPVVVDNTLEPENFDA